MKEATVEYKVTEFGCQMSNGKKSNWTAGSISKSTIVKFEEHEKYSDKVMAAKAFQLTMRKGVANTAAFTMVTSIVIN